MPKPNQNHNAKPGYNLTKLGWIPEEWIEDKLLNLVKRLNSGVSVNSEERRKHDHEFGVLKTGCVSDGRFDPNEHKTILKQEYNRAKLNPIKGSIIISRMNTPDLVGACGYVSETWLDLFLPDRLWQTILNHDLVEGKWLNFLLNTDNYKTKIKNIATGTSNSMKNISKSSFLQLSLPLPPLPEQQKIAQILSTWDEAIQKTETLIAKKQQLKIGLMQALLTGQKRFKEFVKSTKFKATKLGQVPQDWDVCAVSELFQFIPTNSFSRAQMNYHSVEGSIYNIHYGDIHATYNHVILDVSKSEKLIPVLNNNLPHNENAYLKDGDLVIADASEDYKGVGDCVELKNIQGRKVLSGLHTVALRDKAEKTSDGYRAYLFKNEPVSISMMKLARGSKVYGITKTSVSKLEVILPPKEEQQKIASVLSQADDEIESLQKHLEQLKIQKKGLMQTLLTGQVRVNAESNQYKL